MKLFGKINKLIMTRSLFYRTTVLYEYCRIMCDCKWPVMYYFYKYVIAYENKRLNLGRLAIYLDINKHSGTGVTFFVYNLKEKTYYLSP